MKKYNLLLSFLLLAFSLSVAQVKMDTTNQQAIKAAEKWLNLVDNGEYNKSWESAAPILQNAISKEKWNDALKGVFSPIGSFISRKIISSKYLTSIPGAPNGEYVVIQFSTKFEKKENAIETITPMKVKNGTWKVSGYYIK